MPDRDRLVALLRESATRFVDSFRATSDGQFHFKSGPERWSIAEVAEHVIISETGSAKLMRGRLVREAPTPELLAATADGDARVDARLTPRDNAFAAPDFVLPTGRWNTPREMVEVFEESRNGTIDYLLATGLDLTKFVAPHPALGPLNGHQWAYFLVRHAERHTDQIEAVKRHPSYPDT
ncbi:MAG: DinB family protein [Gemmatimonadetes bacterium]|nr:DinB family protein [Gemmatimonadota bacterium]